MNGEDARNVFQRPRRTKEQTEMKNTLGEINSRIPGAEEQISDLKGRVVENHCCKTEYIRKNEKKKTA